MAGEYGEIDSRADYYRLLGETKNIVQGILSRNPSDLALQRIQKQLNAMTRWSDNGREPTESERNSIDVGLTAVRELSEAAGETDDLANKLFALNNYFEDWPTDKEASSATDDDFEDY